MTLDEFEARLDASNAADVATLRARLRCGPIVPDHVYRWPFSHRNHAVWRARADLFSPLMSPARFAAVEACHDAEVAFGLACDALVSGTSTCDGWCDGPQRWAGWRARG